MFGLRRGAAEDVGRQVRVLQLEQFEDGPHIGALFDFDGTLSLIREGWPDVMVPMFVEMLPAVPGEKDEDRRRLCLDDIMRLNGKQTIYQMIQLAERITERGGNPREPLWYKHEYLRRLAERITTLPKDFKAHPLVEKVIADRAAMVRRQQRAIIHGRHAAHILKRLLNYLSVPAPSVSSLSTSIVKLS